METAILTSIITSACTLIGVIVTVAVNSRKQRTIMELRQKEQQKEIDELRESIKQHNSYAVDIPVMKTQLSYIEKNLEEIKKKVGA